MKVILILGLVLGFVVSRTSQAAGAKKHEASVPNKQVMSIPTQRLLNVIAKT